MVSATSVARNFNPEKISELDIYIFLQRNGTIKFASEQKRAFCLDTKDVWQGAKLRVVAEAPWSVAEWAVALRFDHPRAIVLLFG